MTGWVKRLLLAAILCVASMPALAAGRTFRLGIITDKPVEKKIEGYAPMADYVAKRLKAFGVTGGKVVVAGDLDAMLQLIRKNEVDVVLESAVPTIRLSQKAGMKPKLLVWKHGVREYHTVYIARKDSGIADLKGLRGKLLALQDPGSTSAFLIPRAELKGVGLKLVPQDAVAPPAAVRYVLVAHEKNQAFWVIQKKADAAAFSSDDWAEFSEEEKRDLKVIHASRPVIRYLASFHPKLPKDLSAAISQILTGMDRDPEGKKILEKASETSKMEPLSAKDLESLEYVRRLMEKR